jgi:hypothetical protein
MKGQRCVTCGGWTSSACVLCRGVPDRSVTLELLARAVNAVDRAARRGSSPLIIPVGFPVASAA